MNVNAGIIDQRVQHLLEQFQEELPKGNEDKKRSAAFVLLCVKTMLDITEEEALDFIVDGGQDAGIDAIHVGEVQDGEFSVSLFQGKYDRKLTGESAFPEKAVIAIKDTIGALFDPDAKLSTNRRLRPRVEEVRSLIRDGYIPSVHVLLCNNGQKWDSAAQEKIDAAGLGSQVNWEHVNHDRLVQLLKGQKPVNDSLRLSGKAIVEEFNFRRVLVGRIPVTEIRELFDRHGDLLLQRNIRRFLGMNKVRVNEEIRRSLIDPDQRKNFYFYNNGVTMICTKFSHNALQGGDYQLRINEMQIINGGQTCKTIQTTLQELPDESMEGAQVMLRLYELDGEDENLVRSITLATNSQNPVDLRDLRSSDERQKRIEIDLEELGYHYKRFREMGSSGSQFITSSVAAESVLAVWRRKPHQAKFRRADHFGKLYDEIFSDTLNGAQLVIAVLIFRLVENERKRPSMENPPDFIPYASHFLAMIMGALLLKETELILAGLDHRTFARVRTVLEEKQTDLYSRSIEIINESLPLLIGKERISLQRLSATFRRGDLLEVLRV